MTKESLLAALEVEKGQTKRDRLLSVRLTPAEYQAVTVKAKQNGISAATLARVLILTGLADIPAEKAR